MKDILHQVRVTEFGFICDDCEVVLPPSVCITGLVAEIAGTGVFVPVMPGDEPRLSCSSRAVEKVRETGQLVAEIEVEIPEQKRVQTKSLSDVEKIVNRGAWNNFLAMRHQIRPAGLDEDIS